MSVLDAARVGVPLFIIGFSTLYWTYGMSKYMADD